MKKVSQKSTRKPFNLEHEVRGLGVMVEHVDHKLTLVGEVLSGHTKTLDSHTKILETHTELLEKHTQTFDLHTEMIGGLATDVEVIKADIEFIKHGFKKKVDVEEFAALERRVMLLEKRR
jgi:hypothetical protein